jgi:hypothetical protein
MKHPFDINRVTDVPDPLAGISDLPLPPRREVALVDSPTRSGLAAARATALGAALLYEVAWVAVMSKRADLRSPSRRRGSRSPPPPRARTGWVNRRDE